VNGEELGDLLLVGAAGVSATHQNSSLGFWTDWWTRQESTKSANPDAPDEVCDACSLQGI
jgi:hypothetical protein